MDQAIARVVEPFLAEVDAALGATYTAILFGSAARGDYVTGRSDLNLMLILERADTTELARLRPAFARWRKAAPGLPLVISRQEWLHGVDVFPIEICDLRASHQVLRGPDLVDHLRPDPADLRRALEKEFRGKLLRLRQRYVGESDTRLGEWAGGTVSAIVLFFRCLLLLTGRPAPAEPSDVIEAAAGLLGFDPAPLLKVLVCRSKPKTPLTASDFEAYLAAVERAAQFTDQLELGGQHS
jgi:predicted nucleotidyltransferase